MQLPHILVVDDDAGIRRLLQLSLSMNDLEVTSAPDGLVALEQILERRPEVMILDLQMPRMDGRALVHRLREEGITVPTIILSAGEAERAARELGVEAWIAKPFDADIVADRVSELLATG